MFDTDTAELACDGHHARWMALATEDVRRKALGRLLVEWDRILAQELGERIGDIFTRLEILDLALDDFERRIDAELGTPPN